MEIVWLKVRDFAQLGIVWLKVRDFAQLGKGLVDVELADPPMISTAKTSEFWKYNNYEE